MDANELIGMMNAMVPDKGARIVLVGEIPNVRVTIERETSVEEEDRPYFVLECGPLIASCDEFRYECGLIRGYNRGQSTMIQAVLRAESLEVLENFPGYEDDEDEEEDE